MRAKTLSLLALSATAALLAPAALAADLFGPLRGTQTSGPMLTPTHVWDGTYFGGYVGRTELRAGNLGPLTPSTFPGGTANAAIVAAHAALGPLNPASRLGRGESFGVFVGQNYQFDEVVLGLEADLTFGTRSAIGRATRTSVNYTDYTGETRMTLREVMTLRARAGYTIGSFMPFVTAGLAIARADIARSLSATHAVDPALTGAISMRRNGRYGLGLAAGAGVDVGVTENLFVRGEWQHLSFHDFQGLNFSTNTIRAAAGVKF